MGLTVKKEVNNGTVTLYLNGILDITTASVIDSNLEGIGEIEMLIFDFSALEFIDSTGIGSIMNAIYMSQDNGFILKLKGEDELTRNVLETVGIYEILHVMQREAE